jgi:hypothetical protein
MDFLKESFVFNQWPMDQIVKLAYAMKQRECGKGEVFAKEGGLVEYTWFIVTGKVKITTQYEVPIEESLQLTKKGMSLRAAFASKEKADVEVAYVRDKDMLGLVELANRFRKQRRTFTAVEPTTMYFAETDVLTKLLQGQPKTKELVAKLAQTRRDWESLRKHYLEAYPSLNPTLPVAWKDMSKYILQRESGMTRQEIKARKEKSYEIFRRLREARELRRPATGKQAISDHLSPGRNAVEARVEKADEKCLRALELAAELKDERLESRIGTVRTLLSAKDYGSVSSWSRPNTASTLQTRQNHSSQRVGRERGSTEEKLDAFEECKEEMENDKRLVADDWHSEKARQIADASPTKLLLDKSNRRQTLALLAENAGFSFDR